MKENIIRNSDNPEALERLYQQDSEQFEDAFQYAAEDFKDQKLAEFWYIRLQNVQSSHQFIEWGKRKDIFFVVAFSLMAGFLVKLPEFTPLDYELYLQRNLIFLFAPFIAIYLIYKDKIEENKAFQSMGLILFTLAYSNTLHYWNEGQVLLLSHLHITLFIWFVVGWVYCRGDWKDLKARIDYLSFNGSLAVVMAIVLAAGVVLAGLTVALFSFIDPESGELIMSYLAPMGLIATPIVGTYLLKANPGMVDRLTPMIAKIFSPLAIIVLISFIIASILNQENPFYDRDFLLVVNFVFIAVIALTLFLVSEIDAKSNKNYNMSLILALSALAVIIGLISLASIIFRINEWGFTANRTAVLGANILLLTHTSLIVFNSVSIFRGNATVARMNTQIAQYLIFYFGWAAVVAFLFPIIF